MITEKKTTWTRMRYIGYADGTFVPFRNLNEEEKGQYGLFKDEKQVRECLCFLQKLGNSEGGCTMRRSPRWFEDRDLKRNHHSWEIRAEYDVVDLKVFDRTITNRFIAPGRSGQVSEGTAQTCTQGFCD